MLNNNTKPRVLLFLGAGASYFAGHYTFVDFPELLFNSDLRKKEGMPALSHNSGRILRAIRDSLERNNIPTTHDNFLWRLDGYTQFLRLNQSDDVLQEFLRENARLYDLHLCTEQAIQQISASTIYHYSSNRVLTAKVNNVNCYESMRKVYMLYKNLAFLNGENATLPIYTTNYDMLIEDLSQEFREQTENPVSLINGIPNLTDELAIWRDREYKKKNGAKCSFHLHRLHGCVCWFYHAQGDGNIYFHRQDAPQQQTEHLYAMYPGRETQIGMGSHGHSFKNFYKHLQVCDLAVFIGFSFRDDDVMHVLLKALAERNGKLKLLIIDKLYTDKDIRNKLKDAARRSTFPSRIPKEEEIDSLKISFGTDTGFDEDVLKSCKALLNKNEGN